MRIRTATLVLSLSATAMIAGLGLASAQPQQPRPGLQTPVPGLRPAVKQKLRDAAKAREDATPTPSPSDDSSGTPASPGQISEFQTGIDYQPMSPRARVTFNLEDADLPDLVRLISNITGKRFILPAKARSIKATVFAPTKVTAAEAYHAFLTILQQNGMTIVQSGRYVRIVETSGIQTENTPIRPEGSATPWDARFITRMVRLESIDAQSAQGLLSSFTTREGNITAYNPTNTLIITDTGENIRRIMRLLEEIDVPSAGERIWVEPIHYGDATQIAERLREIFPVGESGGASSSASETTKARRPRPGKAQATEAGSSAPASVGNRPNAYRITNILPDERTNSLIIMATERAYLRILQMVRVLDIPVDGEGEIHVHYVQNSDAAELAGTLQALISGGGRQSSSSASKNKNQSTKQQQTSAAVLRRTAATGSLGGADIFGGNVRIEPYEPANALVITANAHEYAALRRVIERLDSPRRQVFIEAVIMELSVDRSSNLGLAFHGGVPNLPAEGSLSLFGFQAGQSLSPIQNQDVLTSLALGVQGPAIPESQQLVGLSIPGFGVVLTALATAGDVNILSTPHIMAMDNVQAEISVGDNIPLQTQSGLGGLGGLGGLAGLAGLGQTGDSGAAGLAGLAGLTGSLGGLGGSLPRQDVGTTIRITPHINEADEIRMEIEQEISEAGPQAGPLGAVSISKRTAKTEIMVRDQQTIVIGGLVRDRVSTTESKVPILGDIPLIGALFRSTQRQNQKRNLLLFLTPYIVRDPQDLRSIFERKMQERQEFLDRYFVFGDRDYEPPIDYSRTRGLVSEIINELDSIQEERDLLEAARGQPPPEHVPRPPVGSIPFGEGEIMIGPDDDGGDDGDDGDFQDGGDPDLPDSVTVTPELPDILEQQQEDPPPFDDE